MSENSDNFLRWFAKPLEHLYSDNDAGFMIVMTVLPLLERYLREKSGSHEDNLNNAFYDELRNILGLSDDEARNFWQIYRNGFLHQATVSGANRKGVIMPDAYVTGKAALVTYDKAKEAFYVNPEEFGRKVIEAITKDFGTYEGAGSPFHRLPVVTKHGYSGWPMS